MKKYLLMFSLVVSGCSTLNTGLEVMPEFSVNTSQITVHVDPGYVKRECGMHAQGCAFWNKNRDICHIYIHKKPEIVNDDIATLIGHEVMHCYLGKYHNHNSLHNVNIDWR